MQAYRKWPGKVAHPLTLLAKPPCRDEDPQIFHPGPGTQAGADRRRALDCCSSCPLSGPYEACATYARVNHLSGIWGGVRFETAPRSEAGPVDNYEVGA